MIAVLCGGVGAARMLAALGTVVDPADLTGIVNVGDDLELHGLRICPDLDTITYTLADEVNPDTGWGLRDESWQAMEMVDRYGGVRWFALGDRDLGTHLYRSQRMAEGADLSTVTREITAAWGLGPRLLPATDDRLRTMVTLAHDDAPGDGSPGLPAGSEIGFQEYFVRRRHDVAVSGVRIDGEGTATPGPGVLEALRRCRGRRHRTVEPDRLDRAGPGRRRRARCRRRPAPRRRGRLAHRGRCGAQGPCGPTAPGAGPRAVRGRRRPLLRRRGRHPRHRRRRRRRSRPPSRPRDCAAS